MPDEIHPCEQGQTETAAAATVADPPRVFRLRWYYLVIGIVGAVFFAAMGLFSVCSAYWNIDGSFPHPVRFAIGLGIVWSAFVLVSLWIITAYFRERLELTPVAIILQGVVYKRVIRWDDVSKVAWRRGPRQGVIVIRTSTGRSRIWLDNFTDDERRTIIDFVQHSIPVDLQEGWQQFAEAVTRAAQPQSAWTAAVCMTLFAAMSLLFLMCAQQGLGMEWLFPGLASLSAAVWYGVRIRAFLRRRAVQMPNA